MAQMCGDPMMLKTFEEGKDFYAMIASLSFHRDYEDCLEFYPEGTPIKKVDGKWVKCPVEESEKLAGYKTDTNTEGKKYRTNSKSILLGILYGRGDASVAEQLGCSVEEAREIKQALYKGFPAIEKFEKDGLNHAEKYGWVSTLWGRKRRLPDINLPEYEVFEAILTKDGEYVKGDRVDDIYATPIINKVRKAFFNQRRTLIEELKKKGYYVVSNGGKIAQARRQVTNSQIQGCQLGNTLLHTKEYGIIKIKDVAGESLHVWDGKDWTRADIVYTGKKQLCHVKYHRGIEFSCSPNHKLLEINTRGREKFIETQDLMTTKMKRRIRFNEIYVKSDYVYKSIRATEKLARNANEYYLDDIGDSYKIGIFLGRLASDGNIPYDRVGSAVRLLVAEHELEILDVLKEITSCWETHDMTIGVREGRTQKLYWHNIYSKTLVDEIKALNTRFDIPDEVFQDTEMLRGYLCGMFDGDGTVVNGCVSLRFGKNHDYSTLLNKIQLALSFFGIRSTWRQNKCDDSYTLDISRYDNKSFEKYIGFISNGKKEKLSKAQDTYRDEHIFGKCDLVDSVEITDEFVDMYDVCNTERGYYVANGFVTHNSAADMSKKALIKLNGDDRLNALHAKPIIPIHDEVILSSPFRYAREVEKRFAYDMETAATDKLHLDISTDVEVTFNWYGESLDLDKELKDFEEEVDDTLVK
jgi:putative DNA polymerase